MPRRETRPSATWPTESSCRAHCPATKHRRAAAGLPGRQQDCGPSSCSGGSRGCREQSPAPAWLPTTLDQEAAPSPGCALPSPFAERAGSQRLSCLTLVLAQGRAPQLWTRYKGESEERWLKMKAVGETNIERAHYVLGVSPCLYHYSWPGPAMGTCHTLSHLILTGCLKAGSIIFV